MHARVVLWVGKGVLFREVSSVRGFPYRGVPLCTYLLFLTSFPVQLSCLFKLTLNVYTTPLVINLLSIGAV